MGQFEMNRQIRHAIDRFAERAKRATAMPTFCRIGPWSVGISRDDLGCEARVTLLSAKLKQSHSGPEEWKMLGAICAAVGVPDPQKSLLTPVESTHPEATHYWAWREDGQPIADNVLAALNETIASIRVSA